MSRIGKKEIVIPAGTEVVIAPHEFTVKGKGGTLSRPLHPAIGIEVVGSAVKVLPRTQSRLARALWGTYASHVANMIQGVNQPFVKKLIVEGIGYRAEAAGGKLKLQVGFSHPILVAIPKGLGVAVEKNVVTVSGADKEMVGQFAADVRSIKKPEPYKGKGIRYDDEVIRRKEGKRTAAAA
ncbi:MAG TPA: 50S ribosomal protein L6 [Candidatus Paceibacterota bacterium]